ncbi:MAG: GNAT family N-acetyltransferase, partial [Gemmataceae bacterium]|nr:GNAT family N-acetyltransferase [Gemmataceae bacterium]
MIDKFSTPRLAARALEESDWGDWLALHRDLQGAGWLTWDGVLRTDAQARAVFDSELEHWRRHGYGSWSFRGLVDGRFVGCGGLRRLAFAGGEEAGWHVGLVSASRGRGFATEIGEAVLGLAFDVLRLPSVVAAPLP